MSSLSRGYHHGRDRSITGKRHGIVYGIVVRHRGQIYLGYVGQTRQKLEAREQQHREWQPWGDIIVGRAFVLAQGFWTDRELDTHEEFFIRHGVLIEGNACATRPLYNIIHNTDNVARVLPWVVLAERHKREPGWSPPRQWRSDMTRPTVHDVFVHAIIGSAVESRLVRRTIQTCGLWLILIGILLLVFGVDLSGSALLAACITGVVVWKRTTRGRSRPRRRGRRRRPVGVRRNARSRTR